MGVLARKISAVSIAPLYRIGERSNVLRGTPLRAPVQILLRSLSRMGAADARKIFENSPSSPEYLHIDQIESMLELHQLRPTRRDTRKPHEKCLDRVREVLRCVERHLPSRAMVLELACGDCTVAEQVQQLGHHVHGIDLATPKRATTIRFAQMDATKLDYPSDVFDLIYAFDSFEHFSDPQGVLREAHRVLKPGGMLYASFGPLWNSAMGAHQWFSVDLPYCHLLFRRDEVNAFAGRIGKPGLTPNLNFWSLRQFRDLFSAQRELFDELHYFEKFNVAHVDMIAANPGCFRAKVDDFDELVVRSIEVLLRKRG